jgi:hypothetical protein
MAKQVNSDKPTKWEVVYENEQCTSIWKYDSNVTKNGPVSVEHKWKKGFDSPTSTKKKTLGDLANDAKKVVKSKRPKS